MKYQLENSLNSNETLTKEQIKKAKAQEYHLKLLMKKNEGKYKDKIEGYDYLVCQCCNGKFGELTSHIKIHGYTKEQYMEEFKLDSLKAQLHHDSVKGENNPAYNHGGKYSPWSKNFIKGYDEELHENFKKHISIKNNENKHNNKFCLEYWLIETNGDEKLAKQLYSKYQTRDLEYFVNRYGDEIGTIKYNEKTEKWMNSFTSCNYSEISQELFNEIATHINCDYVYYATFDRPDMEKYKNKEYILKLDSSFIRPDFIDINLKKIIEFDGDYWHSESVANPIREQNRNEQIKSINHSVLHVKEHEYKKDKEKVIQECLNFLKQ